MGNKLSISQKILLEYSRLKNLQRKNEHALCQLFWECTLKCNLHCQHCGSDCKTDDLQKDMPLFHFERVLDEIKEHMSSKDILVITTGGEPLVRKDIVDCGKAITERGFMWGMVSNGMLLTLEKLDELIDAGLKTISISFDGFESEHNWMRGHPESFKRAEVAIAALMQRNIVWDVITCVNKVNIDSIVQFRDYLISKGIKHWRIFTVFPAGRAKDNDNLQLTSEQYKYLLEFIAQTRREGKIDLSYGCEGFLGNYELKVRNYPFFCQAGINVASILNDGSISGCLSIRSNYNQGNIYENSFIDVWNTQFQLYRNHEWMKNGDCTSCKMWRYCEGNGMHLRDDKGNLLLCNMLKITTFNN